jgi:hypothetical protein
MPGPAAGWQARIVICVAGLLGIVLWLISGHAGPS